MEIPIPGKTFFILRRVPAFLQEGYLHELYEYLEIMQMHNSCLLKMPCIMSS